MNVLWDVILVCLLFCHGTQSATVESLNANVTQDDEALSEAFGLTPSHEYMNLLCNRKLVRSNRDAIRMSPWTTKYPPSSTSCVVGVENRVYSHYRFVVTFKSISLYGATSVGTCYTSRLDLFSGQSTATVDRINGVNGLCGTRTPRTSYETRTNFLTLEYTTRSLPSGHPQYFEAVITPFHTGSCAHDEIRCGNGNCIKNNMLCDSYNNCGDDTDETNCAALALSIAAIIGIVVGCVVVVGIVATIFICKCCCGICGYERL